MQSNTTGDSNTASGVQALYHNTTGSQNTAIGVGALTSNAIGGNNTASGTAALGNNNTGSENTASRGAAPTAATNEARKDGWTIVIGSASIGAAGRKHA